MNSPEFKFSVIIPTYNRADLLQVCLQALVDQVYKNFEVIVCDDGSSDNSGEVVKSFEDKLKITYFFEENWGGPARPRNNGLKLAKGEWVAFLDSDDYWSPNKLEVINRHLDEADVLYHRMIVLDQNNNQISAINSKDIALPCFENMLIEGNRIPLSSVVCRKSKVLEAGRFTEERRLISVEDFDLWLKLSLMKCRFLFVPEFLGYYYFGGGNISQASVKQVRKLRAIYLKYLPKITSKETKRLVLGSFYYQKFRMFFMVERNSRYYKILKKAFFLSDIKTKFKILAVFSIEYLDLIRLYRKILLNLTLKIKG